MKNERKKILIGNTFPLPLVRRAVRIAPYSLNDLKMELKDADVFSFWGHVDTKVIVEGMLNIKLDDKSIRKPLCLSKNNLPMLDGVEFDKCFVISPNYRNGFRPALNKTVSVDDILSWDGLCISWE